MMPLLPGITGNLENVKEIISLAKKTKVDFIYPSFGFTMREGNREYLYEQLKKNYKGYKEKYIKLFGNEYVCHIPNAHTISQCFNSDCDKARIAYKMDEIITRSKEKVIRKQLSFIPND